MIRLTLSLRIKESIQDVTKPPLLIFPEGRKHCSVYQTIFNIFFFSSGTCVNNDHICMFKKGAFELGAEIIPVAIKYKCVAVAV